jgi:glycosyltransferase involved in cell wall biosynthesis
VHFAGHRANDPNINRMFDISALCSLSEGFPNVIVEAMAAERPVVATAVGGNVDAVRGGTGILVPPAEPAHLANALDRLLRDPVLRRRMGAEGGRVARAEYHVSTVIPRLEAMYCDLLDRFAASPK